MTEGRGRSERTLLSFMTQRVLDRYGLTDIEKVLGTPLACLQQIPGMGSVRQADVLQVALELGRTLPPADSCSPLFPCPFCAEQRSRFLTAPASPEWQSCVLSVLPLVAEALAGVAEREHRTSAESAGLGLLNRALVDRGWLLWDETRRRLSPGPRLDAYRHEKDSERYPFPFTIPPGMDAEFADLMNNLSSEEDEGD